MEKFGYLVCDSCSPGEFLYIHPSLFLNIIDCVQNVVLRKDISDKRIVYFKILNNSEIVQYVHNDTQEEYFGFCQLHRTDPNDKFKVFSPNKHLFVNLIDCVLEARDITSDEDAIKSYYYYYYYLAHSGFLPQVNHGVQGRALDWFEVLGYRVVEDKATDYAHLKQALSEQFPVVRNRSELETRFYSSSQKHNQKPSDFVYDLLKIHKILKLEMTEEKFIDHIISRLEPQILDYVTVRHPQATSNPLQIIDKYEERFLNRKIRGSSWESRDIKPNVNNRFPNRNRQENWRETRGNNRYADNSRPRREFNRFESQGSANNQRFDGRRRGGQSDHRFHNQGGRQSGSRNSAFKGQNDRNRYLNF
ncbi:uncharacterized protein TNCV_3941911 [Trichonephila clavipes]|uniref:Uncharacterized protein n=1 Tax=Trichonephila clavipes TaxID=2585209 RepID=A0A8X6VW26_TRICX|nr:uncharacterized protein TNCV_3941911 [Trichonephila clavipes]